MTTYEGMVCTKAIASEVAGWNTKDIDSVKLSKTLNTVLVVRFDGEVCTFPKSDFIAEFVRNRQQKAQELRAIQKSDSNCIFEVQNSAGDSYYRVTFMRFSVHCECPDFENQLEAFNGTGSCKHIYAALGLIGYSNLHDYLVARNKPGATMKSVVRQTVAA